MVLWGSNLARRGRISSLIAMGLVTLSIGQVAVARESSAAILQRIRQYHGELRDMSAVVEIQNEDNEALSKISPDFAQFVHYGFRRFTYNYKTPDKFRIEGTASLFHALKGISIRNGGKKNFYVPALRIHRTADVTGQPNKKETALDFGLMSGDIWSDYKIWFIRAEGAGAARTYLVGLQPRNEPHGGVMIVFLEAATLRVKQRDRYNSAGELNQRQLFYTYTHPLPHVWLPTVIRLYNNHWEHGADLVYRQVSVNTGLSDSSF